MYFLHKKLTHNSTHKIYRHTVILCRTDGVCIQRAAGSDEAADRSGFIFFPALICSEPSLRALYQRYSLINFVQKICLDKNSGFPAVSYCRSSSSSIGVSASVLR